MRTVAHLVLTLVLSAFAVAPHQHDGLTESVPRDSVTLFGKCDEPQAGHLHASRLVHARACVACVRQHASGALRLAPVAVPRPVVVGTPTHAIAAPAAATVTFALLRAPPA